MDKNCAVFKASNIIGKRWTLSIILELYKGKNKWKRYNHIKSKLPRITPKMLSARLKELVKAGIISKRVDSTTIPIKSEYSLTKHGEEFIDVIKHLKSWSLKYSTNKSCSSRECRSCDF
jgi:DNA-binding HxlR family transcriptional regulator